MLDLKVGCLRWNLTQSCAAPADLREAAQAGSCLLSRVYHLSSYPLEVF